MTLSTGCQVNLYPFIQCLCIKAGQTKAFYIPINGHHDSNLVEVLEQLRQLRQNNLKNW